VIQIFPALCIRRQAEAPAPFTGTAGALTARHAGDADYGQPAHLARWGKKNKGAGTVEEMWEE